MKYQKALGDPATKSGKQVVENGYGVLETADRFMVSNHKTSFI